MNLALQAAADLIAIVGDSAAGFGWPITVTDPNQLTATLTGFRTDISQEINPETGQLVSGRTASVALPIASLALAGLGVPRGIADKTSRPWLITFSDLAGVPHTFKVSEARPDETLGLVVCMLEAWRAP